LTAGKNADYNLPDIPWIFLKDSKAYPLVQAIRKNSTLPELNFLKHNVKLSSTSLSLYGLNGFC
jgi:hypothetical protein